MSLATNLAVLIPVGISILNLEKNLIRVKNKFYKRKIQNIKKSLQKKDLKLTKVFFYLFLD